MLAAPQVATISNQRIHTICWWCEFHRCHTCVMDAVMSSGTVAKHTKPMRQCMSMATINATTVDDACWMKTDSRLLKVALTYVASFANRIDNNSALFSSLSNQPTSLRRIAGHHQPTKLSIFTVSP